MMNVAASSFAEVARVRRRQFARNCVQFRLMPTETINSRTVLGSRSFIGIGAMRDYVPIGRRSYAGANSHMPSPREHACLHHGEYKNRHSKSKCDDTHPALLELS